MESFKCAHTEIVDLHKLQPNPKNPNKHPDRQIELLAKIIDYQGQRAPIVVSKRSGFITKGHGRLMALQKLNWSKAAVDYQDYENEAQEYADLVADNKIAELAKHDDSMMIDELRDMDLGDFDFELLGMEDFSLPEIKQLDNANEDNVPENVETRCKKGDLWILGEHRLLCGDATDVLQVERLMDGDKADMVFTDPPYGMRLDTDYTKMNGFLKDGTKISRNNHKAVAGDNSDFSPELINTIWSNFGYVKEVFVWGADYFAEHIPNRNDGSFIVWDKTGDESRDKGFGSSWELCWSKQKHKRTFARIWWQGIFGVKDDAKNRVHPTQKPTQLAEWFFDKWGKGLKNVVDLFGGSGSTLIACEKTNRKCYMMELDEHYCDVILKRWEDYTGQKARLESNNEKGEN